MKKAAISIFLFLIFLIEAFNPNAGFGQEKIPVGVPLFPTISFPVFIAHEKGFFEKHGLRAEIIRINSEPTTYQALISGDVNATAGAPTGLVQSNIQGVPVVSLGTTFKSACHRDESSISPINSGIYVGATFEITSRGGNLRSMSL